MTTVKALEAQIFHSSQRELFKYVHCSWIENIRSYKPCKYILVSKFSILERNGEKRKVK